MSYDGRLNQRLYPDDLLEELRLLLRKDTTHSDKRIPKFLFLCGASNSRNRSSVREYFGAIRDVHVLFADDLWEALPVDLLTFEHFLAQVSDCILIFLESWGTAAELGAFASLDQLVGKSVVYVDMHYKSAKSFIERGPLQRIKLSNPSGVIYGNPVAIHDAQELWDTIDRLSGLPKKCVINTNPDCVDFSSYCIELLDILSIVGPVRRNDLPPIYKYLKGFKTYDFAGRRPHINYHDFAIRFLNYCGLVSTFEVDCTQWIQKEKLVERNFILFKHGEYRMDRLRMLFTAKKIQYCRRVFERRAMASAT